MNLTDDNLSFGAKLQKNNMANQINQNSVGVAKSLFSLPATVPQLGGGYGTDPTDTIPNYRQGGSDGLNQYAKGGIIKGPGTGTSDSIKAKLPVGDAIIPADVVEIYGKDYFDKLEAAAPKVKDNKGKVEAKVSNGEYRLSAAAVKFWGADVINKLIASDNESDEQPGQPDEAESAAPNLGVRHLANGGIVDDTNNYYPATSGMGLQSKDLIDHHLIRDDMTAKGQGFYGNINGSSNTNAPTVSEYSIGVGVPKDYQHIPGLNPRVAPLQLDGHPKYYDAPSIAPGLSGQQLIDVASGNVSNDVYNNAEKSAADRQWAGKPVFANPLETVSPYPKKSVPGYKEGGVIDGSLQDRLNDPIRQANATVQNSALRTKLDTASPSFGLRDRMGMPTAETAPTLQQRLPAAQANMQANNESFRARPTAEPAPTLGLKDRFGNPDRIGQVMYDTVANPKLDNMGPDAKMNIGEPYKAAAPVEAPSLSSGLASAAKGVIANEAIGTGRNTLYNALPKSTVGNVLNAGVSYLSGNSDTAKKQLFGQTVDNLTPLARTGVDLAGKGLNAIGYQDSLVKRGLDRFGSDNNPEQPKGQGYVAPNSGAVASSAPTLAAMQYTPEQQHVLDVTNTHANDPLGVPNSFGMEPTADGQGRPRTFQDVTANRMDNEARNKWIASNATREDALASQQPPTLQGGLGATQSGNFLADRGKMIQQNEEANRQQRVADEIQQRNYGNVLSRPQYNDVQPDSERNFGAKQKLDYAELAQRDKQANQVNKLGRDELSQKERLHQEALKAPKIGALKMDDGSIGTYQESGEGATDQVQQQRAVANAQKLHDYYQNNQSEQISPQHLSEIKKWLPYLTVNTKQ